MDAQAIAVVSGAVVALTQLAKWAGVPAKFAPAAVLLASLIGVGFWGWSHAGISRETSFDYFAGWIIVAMAAAGVFGFIREGAAGVTSTRKDSGMEPPTDQ